MPRRPRRKTNRPPTHSYPDSSFFPGDSTLAPYDEVEQPRASSVPVTAGTQMLENFFFNFRDSTFYSDAAFFFAVLGIFLMVATKEVRFRFTPTPDLVLLELALRWLQSLTTICLIYSLFWCYHMEWRFRQLSCTYLRNLNLWSTDRIIGFLIEVVVCIIHEPPFLDYDVDVSLPINEQGQGGSPLGPVMLRNPFSLLMFVRVYFVIRLVLTRYYSSGAKILGVWYHFDFTVPFAIRNMMGSHAFTTLGYVGGAVTLIFSYSMHVCDREMGAQQASYSLYLWVTLATMTTVGYGDMVPRTVCGRSVAVLAALSGVSLIAIVTASIYSVLTLLPYESRMVEFLGSAGARNDLIDCAATVIARAWRAYVNRKHWYEGPMSRRNLIDAIDTFYRTRLEVLSYDARYAGAQLFRSLMERIQSDTHVMVKFARRRERKEREEEMARERARAERDAEKERARMLKLDEGAAATAAEEAAEAELAKKNAEREAEFEAARQMERDMADPNGAAARKLLKEGRIMVPLPPQLQSLLMGLQSTVANTVSQCQEFEKKLNSLEQHVVASKRLVEAGQMSQQEQFLSRF